MHCGVEKYINTAAPLGCLDLVQQTITLICPQASLRVHKPEYWDSCSIAALSDESSTLVSLLESWFDRPEGNNETSWLNAQQEPTPPILFVAHDLGGLIVAKVPNASPSSFRLTNRAKALLQAKSQERAHSVVARTFGTVCLAWAKESLKRTFN